METRREEEDGGDYRRRGRWRLEERRKMAITGRDEDRDDAGEEYDGDYRREGRWRHKGAQV
jgi:hypothetical protein